MCIYKYVYLQKKLYQAQCYQLSISTQQHSSAALQAFGSCATKHIVCCRSEIAYVWIAYVWIAYVYCICVNMQCVNCMSAAGPKNCRICVNCIRTCSRHMQFTHNCICVTWLIHMCDMNCIFHDYRYYNIWSSIFISELRTVGLCATTHIV